MMMVVVLLRQECMLVYVCQSDNKYSKTTDGTGEGVFVSSITPLTGGTTYHVRAYATNINGTSYGDDVIFTTNTDIPYTGGFVRHNTIPEFIKLGNKLFKIE